MANTSHLVIAGCRYWPIEPQGILEFVLAVNISDVCFLPNASARRELDPTDKALRATFFWRLYALLACVSIVLITLVWLAQKARSRRRDDSSRSLAWRPLEVEGGVDSDSEDDHADGPDRMSDSDDDTPGPRDVNMDTSAVRHHYEAIDVFFVVYYSFYLLIAVQSSVLFLTFDVYDRDTGLLFECAAP
jgi:hypothetical protein